jgi:hypothetical protein
MAIIWIWWMAGRAEMDVIEWFEGVGGLYPERREASRGSSHKV